MGSGTGGLPIPQRIGAQQAGLQGEDLRRWRSEPSRNGGRLFYEEQNSAIANGFTALVGVPLSDQSVEGVGNLGLLAGSHQRISEFFRWQRHTGSGRLGPEGAGWPREDSEAPNRHGLVHYPPAVRRSYRDQPGAVLTPRAFEGVWPKPELVKMLPGDAVIALHATLHCATRVERPEHGPRLMVYFRVAAERPESKIRVYPEALEDCWL